MSINLKTIATIGFALIVSGMSASLSLGQQVPDAKQPPAVIQYNGDMANILAHLPGVYGRTIGLEVDPRQTRSNVQFNLKQPTLTDVLNAITTSSSLYRWTERDDFIEVVPLTGGSPLLDTRISDFRVDYADESEAINQLLNLPEVQTSMNVMKLRYRDSVRGTTAGSVKKMTFAVKDVSLREVLNKIADENGSRFWMLQRNSAGYFSISTVPFRG